MMPSYSKSIKLLRRIKRVSAAEKKEIIEKIKTLPEPGKHQKQTQFAVSIDFFEGRFLERTWAFRRNKKKPGRPLEVKEVVRRLEGLDIVLVRDVYFTNLGGYNAIWEKKKTYSYHGYREPSNVWYQEDARYFRLDDFVLYTLEDAIKLDPSIKYCAYPRFGGFIPYITIYRKYPEIEMLSKFGLSHLVTDTRCCKRLRKDSEFRKFLARNSRYEKSREANYVDFLTAYKLNLDIPSYFVHRYIYKTSTYKNNINIFKGKEKRIANYVRDQNSDLRFYFDYFEMAKEFVDMSNTRNLFPKNIREAHDYYLLKKEVQAKEDLVEKFKEIVQKYSGWDYKNGRYLVRICKSIQEMIIEGRELHHCLGRMDYDKKMADGKTLIFFVRKKENPKKPFYTVELDPKRKEILQARTDHNQPVVPEVRHFLNEWREYLQEVRA
jgi:hypothetical protein